MTGPHGGTVTFMFTDIEGSTDLLKQLGDRLLVFEVVDKRPDPFNIGQRDFIEQARLAAHDQYRTPRCILAPHRQAALDKIAARRIECAAA